MRNRGPQIGRLCQCPQINDKNETPMDGLMNKGTKQQFIRVILKYQKSEKYESSLAQAIIRQNQHLKAKNDRHSTNRDCFACMYEALM
mmetsp:Transcript_18194/g.37511  ORF Transcript_18194/g.37511 Transcript_18194/m.37511 type:complete len:88 (-) Transcript_18194:69-332(-)